MSCFAFIPDAGRRQCVDRCGTLPLIRAAFECDDNSQGRCNTIKTVNGGLAAQFSLINYPVTPGDNFNTFPGQAGGDSLASSRPHVAPAGGATRFSTNSFDARGGAGGAPNDATTREAGASGGSAYAQTCFIGIF